MCRNMTVQLCQVMPVSRVLTKLSCQVACVSCYDTALVSGFARRLCFDRLSCSAAIINVAPGARDHNTGR